MHAPVTLSNLWAAWTWEPAVYLPLALVTFLYLLGAARGLSVRRLLCFAGALLALVAALVSPLDALSEELFSAHMLQHLALILLAAPLLVLSDLPLALMWALPRGWAQGVGRAWNRSRLLPRAWRGLSSPPGAWLLFAIPLWVWHASAFYEAALGNETVHALEHLSFLLTAMLFWWVLFRRSTASHVRYGMAVFYLFTSSLQSNALGALMTFTTRPWYPYYARFAGAWGLTPLQDQQLAGLIMWIPGGAVFTLLNIAYFAAWFRSLEQRSARLSLHQPRRGA